MKMKIIETKYVLADCPFQAWQDNPHTTPSPDLRAYFTNLFFLVIFRKRP